MQNTEEKVPLDSYRRQSSSNPYMPFIYALVLSLGVMLGYIVNSMTSGKQLLLTTHYNKMDEILNYIDARYVDTINRSQLTDKAIDKLLTNLDPHSVYVPAKDIAEM